MFINKHKTQLNGLFTEQFCIQKEFTTWNVPTEELNKCPPIFLLLARKHYGQPVICVPKLKPLTAINELKIIIFVLNDLSVLVYILKKNHCHVFEQHFSSQ